VVTLEQVRKRADVVLVAVRDDDAGDPLPEGLEGAKIGVDDVDAEATVVERDAAIDEQHVSALLDGHAIHAHFAEATQGEEAEASAAKGKRVLRAMCNAKERLSSMLGSELIGPEVKSVAQNVWAVNMEPEQALAEYGMMALHSKTLFKLLFDNKYVRKFFRA